MNITKVTVTKLNGKIKAIASITLENEFVVSGIKVLESTKGLFVSMPSYKDKDGKYCDICFPVTKEFRQELIDAVLAKYSGESKQEDSFDDSQLPF
jgi:stage V sporulation protein G